MLHYTLLAHYHHYKNQHIHIEHLVLLYTNKLHRPLNIHNYPLHMEYNNLSNLNMHFPQLYTHHYHILLHRHNHHLIHNLKFHHYKNQHIHIEHLVLLYTNKLHRPLNIHNYPLHMQHKNPYIQYKHLQDNYYYNKDPHHLLALHTYILEINNPLHSYHKM